MTRVELDGGQLADAWRAGIYRLLGRTEHINRINVFPVADGDTGTNVAMTLTAVLAAIDREVTPHAGALLARMADAAIDGARGNSGAILAQFLLGLADGASTLARLSLEGFARAMRSGADYARGALTEPREGTILSVLATFGRELERGAAPGGARDFRELFAAAMPPLRASLEATRLQLEELRAANVVDAGALAFLEIAEGMNAWLESGEIGRLSVPAPADGEVMAPGGAPADHRYCTECVVTGEGLDLRRLREALAQRGSSLVVAGTTRKARVHLHTDEPQAVFELAGRFGEVGASKADDLHRQEAAAHHARARRVAIVTDSAADIPEEAIDALGIHMVPARIHFGNRSYLDKVSLTPQEFYRELAACAEPPRTSQPPPGDFRRMYEFLASHYDAVISIALSASVSGTCAAARTAAARVAGDRVQVIDSGNASLGEGLVVMHAAECAAAGRSGPEVAAAVARIIPRTRTFALLQRLEHAVRGGRVPAVFLTLSRWLRLSVVLANQPGGRIGVVGTLFGRRRARSRFARFVQARMKPGVRYRVLVAHADCAEEGARLLAEMTEGLPNVEAGPLTPLGTAIGVHGGPGTLVVGFQECEPP